MDHPLATRTGPQIVEGLTVRYHTPTGARPYAGTILVSLRRDQALLFQVRLTPRAWDGHPQGFCWTAADGVCLHLAPGDTLTLAYEADAPIRGLSGTIACRSPGAGPT